MTISRVASQASGESDNNATSTVSAFIGNVTAGNLIVVCIAKYAPGGDLPAVGDISKSAGTATVGAFSLDRVDSVAVGGDTNNTAIFSAIVTGTGSCTITVGGAPSGTYWGIGLNEYSSDVGWDASRVEDTDTGTGTATAATTADMTSAGGGLFVGSIAIDVGSSQTTTPDAAFATIFEQENGAASLCCSFIDRIVTTGTTDAASWTIGGGVNPLLYIASGVVYKEAAGGDTFELDSTPGAIELAGSSAAVEASFGVAAVPGAIVLSGADADLDLNLAPGLHTLNANAGAIELAASAAVLGVDLNLTANPGDIVLTGISAGVVRSNAVSVVWEEDVTATGYELGWDSVSHAEDDPSTDNYANILDIGDVLSYNLVLTPGTWYINIRPYNGGTGDWTNELEVIVSEDKLTFSLVGTPGAVVLTGVSVDFGGASNLVANPGAIVLTGETVNVIAGRVVNALPGSIEIVGQPADLDAAFTKSLFATPGSMVLTATDATLMITHSLTSSPAAVVLSGASADLNANVWAPFVLDAVPGAIRFAGSSAQLLPSKGGSPTGRPSHRRHRFLGLRPPWLRDNE